MRSPGMIAGVYQAALQRRGIACDVGGDGDLMQTAEIEILFQLLQIIDNPHRDIPLAAGHGKPRLRLYARGAGAASRAGAKGRPLRLPVRLPGAV